MRRTVRTLGLVLAIGSALPASADVVLHLTNGTALPVRAYRYDGAMIYVDLGGNAQIAFPNTLVERVEDPKRSLNLKPSTVAPGQGSSNMTAGWTPPSPEIKAANAARIAARKPPPVETDAYGLAVSNAVPFANSASGTRLQNVIIPDISAARHNNASGDGHLRGAVRVGSRWVMPSDDVPVRPRAVGVSLNSNVQSYKPTPVVDDE